MNLSYFTRKIFKSSSCFSSNFLCLDLFHIYSLSEHGRKTDDKEKGIFERKMEDVRDVFT